MSAVEKNDLSRSAANYPFLQYILEDKSKYKTATEAGYKDPDNDFLIGESGGFLLNIGRFKFVNTHLFTEMADKYRKDKKYIDFKEDSLPYEQLRIREERRRIYGHTLPCALYPDGSIKDIRITGEHYNFLNYGRMLKLDESSIIEDGAGANSASKIDDFPNFIDAQYWYFKIREFIRNNGFHLIIDKTRRAGFSYIDGIGSAHAINCIPNRVVIHVASDNKYLTQSGGLSDFTKNQINFYEQNTPFKRGIASPTASDLRLGYRNKDKVVEGWRSACISVSAMNNPDCAIGKDAKEVKCEELSMFDNFDEFIGVTEPACRTGAYVTGNIICWGTGGSSSSSWYVFESNFYDPKAFNFMPFENVWDPDSRHTVCGYFKPYCWGLQGSIDGKKAMDKDGNSNVEVGLEIANDERARARDNAKTYKDFVLYCGQYAVMPCESFNSVRENPFSSNAIDAWENILKHDTAYHFHEDGMLFESDGAIIFKSNEQIKQGGGHYGKDYYDYIVNVPRRSNEDPHGCVRRWFAPRTTNINGKRVVPEGLYSISYDPVGINKAKDEITNKHSHNSITVWENPHYLNNYRPRMVMKYYGRPETLEEADKICYYMAVMYNCVNTTWVEVNRGETVSNFTKWKALHYLAREPKFIWDNTTIGKEEGGYGIIVADGIKKLEALRMAVEMLYSKCGVDAHGNDILFLHGIYDVQTISELKKWSDVGNYDRVSEFLVRAIEWKARDIKAEEIMKTQKRLVNQGNKVGVLKRNWC